MRKLSALLWGGVSALLGVLRAGPSIAASPRGRAALVQALATEDPGAGLLAGLLGIVCGLRARSRWAVLLGAIGSALAVRAWVRRGEASRAMADALRAGLGLGWQAQIPAEVHHRMGQGHRLDVIGPLLHLARTRVRVTRDVFFAAPDGVALRMDVIEPARAAAAPRPAVIVLHGGAWCSGDKGRYGGGLQNRWLAAQGFVVFDTQYRLGARWPAPVSDVKCAIRWAKANAERFQVDPARVALLGREAGGHLALLAAYAPDDARFPAGCFAEPGADGRVCAVIACGAPVDLRLWPADPQGAPACALGGLPEDVPDRYAEASPAAHVRPGLPPTLVIHGQRDRIVPPSHAELLVNHLHAAGVVTVLLRVPTRHGVYGLPMGLLGPMIQHDLDRFLAWAFTRPQAGV